MPALTSWGFNQYRRLRRRHGEEGQGLAEYSLILALIALVCIAALALLGQNIAAFLIDFAGMIVP